VPKLLAVQLQYMLVTRGW